MRTGGCTRSGKPGGCRIQLVHCGIDVDNLLIVMRALIMGMRRLLLKLAVVDNVASAWLALSTDTRRLLLKLAAALRSLGWR